MPPVIQYEFASENKTSFRKQKILDFYFDSFGNISIDYVSYFDNSHLHILGSYDVPVCQQSTWTLYSLYIYIDVF